jgi:hypothetical protein
MPDQAPVTMTTGFAELRLLDLKPRSSLGARGQVGREGEILLRFESRETLRQSLVDHGIGVAARRDPLRRRVLVDAVDYLSHLGRIALREARGILKDTASHAGRSVIIDVHLRTELGAAEPELCARTARLDDGDADIEGRDVLHRRLNEALDSPLACVIQAPARKGGLAAISGDLDDATAALPAQMRKSCAHHLDRADQDGIDLVDDLFVRQLLGRAKETVAGVVDHDVDLAELGEGLVYDLMDRRRVGHVEMGEPQQVAILGLEIIHRVHLADGASDAVAAGKKLLCHVAAEAAVHAGNDPSSLGHFSNPHFLIFVGSVDSAL